MTAEVERFAAGSVRLACLLVVLTSCTPPEALDFVDASALGRDYAFAVFSDAAGIPLRVLGRVEDEALLAQPAEGQTTLTLIGFDDDEIAEAAPVYRALATAELSLEIGSPPTVATTILSEGRKEIVLAVPPTAAELSRAVDGGDLNPPAVSVLGQLRLVAEGPIVPLPEQTMDAYGATAALAEMDVQIPGLMTATAAFANFGMTQGLDNTHAIVATGNMVFLVEKGRPITYEPYREDQPSMLIPINALSPDRPAAIDRIALGPEMTAGQPREVLIAGRTWERGTNPADGEGHIWSATAQPEGLRLVGSATVALDDFPRRRLPGIEALAIGPDGTAIAGGRDLTILVRAPGASTFEHTLTLDKHYGDFFRDAGSVIDVIELVMFTGIAEAPHLIGTDAGRFIEGDLFAGTFRPPVELRALTPVLERPRITGGTAVRNDSGKVTELWLTARKGILVRRVVDGGQWELVELLLPEELRPCARMDSTGRLGFETNLKGVAFVGGEIFVAPQACSALARVRLPDLCTGVIRLSDEPTVHAGQDNEELTSLGRTLLLTRDNWNLYSLEL